MTHSKWEYLATFVPDDIDNVAEPLAAVHDLLNECSRLEATNAKLLEALEQIAERASAKALARQQYILANVEAIALSAIRKAKS